MLREGISPSLSGLPSKQKQDATVVKKPAGDEHKFLREAAQKCVLIECAIEVFASSAQFTKPWISGRHPLHHGPPRCELRNQPGNFPNRNLICKQQMMNEAQHQYAVEASASAVEQRSGFSIAP